MAGLRRSTAPALAFLAGVVVTYVIFHAHFADNIPWFVRWVFVPGLVVLIPIYAITGSVHDDIITWLVPPVNGLVYMFLFLGFRGIRTKLLTQSRKSSLI